MAKHGGKRKGAGRRSTKAVLPGGAAFSERVLNRIKELQLPDGIKDAEDYALFLLKAQDLRIRKETFLALLFWQFGKPPQHVEHSGEDGGAIKVILLGKKES